MIVSDQFEGDNLSLASEQHDAYHEALGIIVGGCRTHFERACLIVGVPLERSRWPVRDSIDHRTVQVAHDILAGAWRHHVCPPEPPLSLKPSRRTATRSDWLQWLRETVDGWIEWPDIVATFVTIFGEQNTDRGYEAEERLARLLRRRYPDIQWRWDAE